MIRILIYLSLFGAIACAQDVPTSLDCKTPPASAVLQEVLPCVVGKGIDVRDAKGAKFSGRLSVRGDGACDEGSTCELQLRSFLRKRKVLGSEVKSITYRPPASKKRKTLGWIVGLGVAAGIAAVELNDGGKVGVGTVGLGPLFGITTGILAGTARKATVQIDGPMGQY